MLTKITGRLAAVGDEKAAIAIDAFEYEVLIPEFARRRLQSKVGETVSLHTLHYFDGDPSRGKMSPRLVGFLSEIEREFFEMFCSVDGVGVKKALRAMVRPVQEVASMIEDQNAKGLAGLPGIGPATGERIIAKLRRKMPRFALLAASEEPADPQQAAQRTVVEDTYQILLSLGHSENEAHKLIEAALETKKKFKDVDTLLQAVYQKHRE